MTMLIEALLFFAIYYFIGGLAVSLGYHRMLTHKSFRLPQPLEYFLVLLALPAGTPIQWVGNHRQHHARTDLEGDPHSPYHGGFWHAHCGWYLNTKNKVICLVYALAGPFRTLFDGFWRPRTNQEHNHLAQDIKKVKFYRWLSNPVVYFLLCTTQVALISLLAFHMMGTLGLFVYWFSSVCVYNVGDAVDSIGHIWGTRPFATNSRATNNWLLGVLAFGDGWHANHHFAPRRARHGLADSEPDLSWAVLKTLHFLRLASHIQD